MANCISPKFHILLSLILLTHCLLEGKKKSKIFVFIILLIIPELPGKNTFDLLVCKVTLELETENESS